MNQTAHILETGCNGAVVQLPERKYPGIVIQGDSLSIVLSDFEELKANIEKNDVRGVQESLGVLESHLKTRLEFYESSLAKHGIQLPYRKKEARS